MTRGDTAIGLDVGGTHVKAALVSASGEVLARERLDTGDADNAWRDAIAHVTDRLERAHGPVAAIGASCPGVARPDGSGIAWMTGRMVGVVDFDFAAHLRRPGRVPVLNDAMAALLGEAWVGAARGVADAFLLTLGTGVGGAVLAGGRLLKGHAGRAGHLGHVTVDASGPPDICNTPGSVEYFVGNYSLAARTGGRFASTEDLLAAATAGDAVARAAWLDSVRRLAAAIASVVNVVDPQRVILGGGVTNAGEALFAPLRAELDRVEWRPFGRGVELVPAALGEWGGAIGAARNAMTAGAA